MSYLRVRSRSSGTPLPAFLLSTPSRPKSPRYVLPLKRKREHYSTQRSWSYLADSDYETYATAVPHTSPGGQLKGKGKGKPALKGKGKAKASANLAIRVNPRTSYGREKVRARENQHSRAQESPHYRNTPLPVSHNAQQTTPAQQTIQVR
jgi:hypothetical protein